MIQSRFTSNEAVEFEFHRPETDDFINRSTLFVSHVAINFETAPKLGECADIHFR